MPVRLVLATLLLLPVGLNEALAQQQTGRGNPLELGGVVSPILTINSERVFSESAFGRRVAAEVEAKSAKLSSENRQIEADLAAEEQVLTNRRAVMPAREFRALADAFDKKVQQTRQTQAAKSRALAQLLDQEREIFLAAAAPILEKLMNEAGATVILERRSVFVSSSAIEITDAAIALLDKTLGRGKDINP
jgi:Skp family chaperone for outer membrane proteins